MREGGGRNTTAEGVVVKGPADEGVGEEISTAAATCVGLISVCFFTVLGNLHFFRRLEEQTNKECIRVDGQESFS